MKQAIRLTSCRWHFSHSVISILNIRYYELVIGFRQSLLPNPVRDKRQFSPYSGKANFVVPSDSQVEIPLGCSLPMMIRSYD